MALRENTLLEIAKFGPGDAVLTLEASQGIWDPVFDLTAQQDFARQAPRDSDFTTGVTGLSGSESTTTSVRPGLSGILPTGLRYDATATLDHQTGTFGDGPGQVDVDQFASRTGITLNQPLLRDFWIDSGRRSIKVNRKEIQISKYDLELAVFDTVRDVEFAYYDLVAAIDTVKSLESAVEVSGKFLGEQKKRVEAGALAPLEENRAAAAMAQNQADLIGARQNLRLQENLLKSLITANYESWFHTSILPTETLLALPESYDLVESSLAAVQNRPDYNRLVEEVEISGIDVSYAKNQLYPRLDLFGGYGRLGFSEASRGATNSVPSSFDDTIHDLRRERNPSYRFGVSLSVPLFSRTERKRLALARRDAEKAALRLRDAHSQLMMEVQNAVDGAQAEYERVGATRTAREFAEQALEAGEKKLVQGTLTSFEVLELQEDLVSARASEITALSEYQKALVSFYYSEGTLLERRQVLVDYDE